MAEWRPHERTLVGSTCAVAAAFGEEPADSASRPTANVDILAAVKQRNATKEAQHQKIEPGHVDLGFECSSPLVKAVVDCQRRWPPHPQDQEKSTMAENTVKLHRVLRAPPERIYRAFIDADAMAKWLPPHGFTGKVHHLEAKVGGTYRMSFTNLTTGHSHSFGGEFLELVPNERISHTDKFDDPNLPGLMRTTISLRKVALGTELTVVQEGIPSVIPVEACYVGWQESLTLLTQLVEPEIKE
jgi:uncharacterized protein YndB with AHSA1/START domain